MPPTVGFSAVIAPIIFAAVVAVVIYLVVRPTHVHIRGHKLHLHYCWVPCIGVLLMLMCQTLNGEQLGAGIKGDEHIQPLALLVLFMSLAYIAGSLDMTGLFAWLALKLTLYSKGNGRLLFFLYFALSAVTTLLTSNDVSIMCLTPIICYFAAAAGVDPVPYLIAEFLPANILSMALFIGNPTNIIVAQAYNMTFISYAAWMILPTIGATVVCLGVLWFQFRHSLPAQLQLPQVQPRVMLTDKLGAWVGCIILAVCIVLLAVAPTLGWDLWIVTLVCATMHASYNFWAMGGWVKAWHKTTKMRRRFSNISLAELEMQLRERWGRRRRQRQRKATDSDAEEQGDRNGSVRGSVSGSVKGVAAGGDNSARPSRGASPERNGGLAALVVQQPPSPRLQRGHVSPSTVSFMSDDAPDPSSVDASDPDASGPTHLPAPARLRSRLSGGGVSGGGATATNPSNAGVTSGRGAAGAGTGTLPAPAAPTAENLALLNLSPFELLSLEASFGPDALAAAADAALKSASSAEDLAALQGSSSWSFEEVSRWLQQQRQAAGQAQGSEELGTPRIGRDSAPSPLGRVAPPSNLGRSTFGPGPVAEGVEEQVDGTQQGQGQGQDSAWPDSAPLGLSPFSLAINPRVADRLLEEGSVLSDSSAGPPAIVRGDSRGVVSAPDLGRGVVNWGSSSAGTPLAVGPRSNSISFHHTLGFAGRRWRPHALAGGRGVDGIGEVEEQRHLLQPSPEHEALEVQPQEEEAPAVSALTAGLKPREPAFLTTFAVLPWAVVPFVLGFFVLVQGLYVQGWVDKIAVGLGSAASAGLGPALLMIGSLSIGAANFMNNQPMTVLFTEVLLAPAYEVAAGPAAHKASLFALIIGSNLGANFTLIGALAGIMWVTIIRDRGVTMNYLQFFKLVWMSGVASTIASLFILWAEFAVMT